MYLKDADANNYIDQIIVYKLSYVNGVITTVYNYTTQINTTGAKTLDLPDITIQGASLFIIRLDTKVSDLHGLSYTYPKLEYYYD